MRFLRLLLAYLIALVLFGFLFPVFSLRLGRNLDSLLGLGPFYLGGLGFLLGPLVILFGSFWAFWAWYSLLAVGKGHPQEAFGVAIAPSTRHLVATGPYRCTRNPMVFGFLVVLAGLGFLFESLSATTLVPITLGLLLALYLRFFEEPNLVKRFGEEYERYRKAVPMIVPRLRGSP